ncbi:MAG: DUF515 domain-containing protein [Methanobacteriota archaeon]
MAEKKENIIERLEALRKRVPEEKGPSIPVDVRRKRLARLVGILVIMVFIGLISLLGYSFLFKPVKEKIEVEDTALAQAKAQKINYINDAFAGLPARYMSDRAQLINQVNQAATVSQVQEIDFSTPASNAWRSYTLEKVNEIARKTEKIEMEVGKDIYRELATIRQKISLLSYAELKTAVVRELRAEYVPIRLLREQAAMGLAEPGNIVNIYFKNGSSIAVLAKDAKVVAVLRAKASGSINLAETEKKTDTGGGIEGYGTAASLSIGATSAALTGSYEGSTGLKMRQSETAYTVNIEELQKAAAASKLPESYIKEVLANYGLKLNAIERETNIGDLGVEYLMLFEVSNKEAPELVLRALSSEDRKNIFVTISEISVWMKGIG